MVFTRGLAHSKTPMTHRAPRSAQGLHVPLIPVREYYTSQESAAVVNAPQVQQLDVARDATLATSLLTHADRVFPGVFVLNKQFYNAKYFEDGMHQILGMGNDDKRLQVIMHDGDPDLVRTTFSDTASSAASEDHGINDHGINLEILKWCSSSGDGGSCTVFCLRS